MLVHPLLNGELSMWLLGSIPTLISVHFSGVRDYLVTFLPVEHTNAFQCGEYLLTLVATTEMLC